MATNTPLQSIVLTAPAASVTFSNIDQSYTDLVIVTNFTTSVNDLYAHYVQVNGDTGSNYSRTNLYGTGATPASARQSNNTSLYFGTWSVDIDTTDRSATTIFFNNYSNTTTYKTVMGRHNVASVEVGAGVGTWRNTAAITSINLAINSSTYAAGSTFDLYGIKSGAPKAMGGDVVATDGNYWYHAFRNSGTFTPQYLISCDVLVVAGGGGGGGGGSGGGGGAGGIFYATSQSLSSAQTVTIGAGGASDTSGANSVFGSLTAAVAGGGGGSGVDGLAGGSGGGAYPGQIGGTTTQTSTGGTGYGNAGGNGGAFTSPYASGGGGGAGAAGSAGNSGASQSGAGGAGLNTWSSWASITGTGASGYFAGGGGGGANQQYGGNNGAGGAGGGGAGANPGTAATANTGGGGGGSQRQPSGAGTGGAGGSGVVIVRYAV